MKYLHLKTLFFVLVFLASTLWSAPKIEEPFRRYDISWQKDLPLSFFAFLAVSLGNYKYGQMNGANYTLQEHLLPWDKPLAGRYSEGADLASDIMGVLAVAPLVGSAYSFFNCDMQGRDFFAFSLQFAEALALQSGLNLWMRSFEFWPRPYIYATSGDGLKAKEEARGEAYGSFFSGHTSAAFTVATFMGEWFSSFYPNSKYKTLVWASGYSVATFMGALRIAAGKHYFTDVIVGALAGTGVSLAVLQLHKTGNQKISVYAGVNALQLAYRF